MTETPTTALAGFRNAIMIMRDVAELLEKNPEFSKPKVTFDYGKELTGEVYFHLSSYHYDYNLSTSERKEQARLKVETLINQVIDTFGPELEWVSNDPSESSFNKSYFTLEAQWKPGVIVKMLTSRDAIGEMVDVVESGPQVLEQGGTVQLVRQTATIWKPNITIGRRATPQYELEAKPLVLALTEADPF